MQNVCGRTSVNLRLGGACLQQASSIFENALLEKDIAWSAKAHDLNGDVQTTACHEICRGPLAFHQHACKLQQNDSWVLKKCNDLL